MQYIAIHFIYKEHIFLGKNIFFPRICIIAYYAELPGIIRYMLKLICTLDLLSITIQTH